MFYKKGVDISNTKSMFNFLHDHYEYFTMNSWNGRKSIAHNVKLYNLHLRNDWSDALKALEDDDYFTINHWINEFEYEHGVKVGFNGSSGGYIVLYPESSNGHIFSYLNPSDYDSYEDFKEDVIEYEGSLKNHKRTLRERVKLVQDFDRLCDDLVSEVDRITDRYLAEKAKEREVTVTKRFETYSYDSIEDRDIHMAHMKKCGYTVYQIIEDTMVEYEMNESSTLTLKKED